MFNDSTTDFQTKVLARSGLGDETYLPPCACALGGRSFRAWGDGGKGLELEVRRSEG